MIRVIQKPEPASFDRNVRQRGATFLVANPNPTAPLWKQNDFWKQAHSDLYNSYGGICSYCGLFTVRAKKKSTVQDSSIDHFVPKSRNPQLAYEWDNFRLSRAILNSRKDDYIDVLDPFSITSDWFSLNFYSSNVEVSTTCPPDQEANVKSTIKRLGLNTDVDLVNERTDVVVRYCAGKLLFADIESKFPFIAYQMAVQRFDDYFLDLFRSVLLTTTLDLTP